MALPDCGIYRTTVEMDGVPAGRLVYFHNHGDPGPGIYLPVSWFLNRATFSPSGITLTDPPLANTMEPLAREGLYRVERAFTCCAKNCMTYEPGLLVQLGYNGSAEPLLFTPAWSEQGLSIPEVGQRIDADRVERLSALDVADAPREVEQALH